MWACTLYALDMASGRNHFQLEVPESALLHHTPNDYELKSQRKGYWRYWTNHIEDLLARLTDTEERRDSALKDTMRTIFHSFDNKYDTLLLGNNK